MNGLMMDLPLTITSLMNFAEKNHADTEIVSVTRDNPRHRYVFADAFKRVRQLANALQDLGVTKGDRIATLAWNDYRHFELYYAVSCSGMICHTINPRLFTEQIEYIINHAEDKIIFIDADFVPLIETLQDKISTVQAFIVLTDKANMPDTVLNNIFCYESLLEHSNEQFFWPSLNEYDGATLCYTSGTTGNPKGVLYSHRSTVLHAYAGCMIGVFGLGNKDVIMPIVPMFHVGAWGIPYTAAMTGTKVVFPGSKMADGEILTTLINEEKITFSAGVPTVWLALLQYLQQSGKSIDPLTTVLTGGSACALSIMEELEDKHGVYTHVGWGMTEMSPLGTFNPRLDRKTLGYEEYSRLRVKAGRCIYGVEMKIVDQSNNDLPWDGKAFGTLKVRGPWVCSGYFRMEEGDSHDAEGWFDTGDVATIDAQGFLQITDRSKDVIKSGGEWISSIELENTAMGHPLVAEAAVIAMAHEKWTERPLLLVRLKDNVQLSQEEMLNWFDGKVARWWIPQDCLFVDELAYTATGKLSKKTLRERFKGYRFPD
jgi:3-(methylthio)propionyl---CoA ligase